MRFPVFMTLPLLALVVAQLVGCASMGGHSGRFPSKQQIEDLAALPQVKLGDVPILDVRQWRLEAPVATRMGDTPVSPIGPWETLLYERAGQSGSGVRLTAPLRCFAAEFARFFAQHRSRPGEILQTHLAAACGVVAQDLIPYMIHGTVPEGYSEARLQADWAANISQALGHAFQGGRRLVGIAQARQEDHVVLVVVGGLETIRLAPFVPVPDERGRLMIEGRFLRPVERVWAAVNQGEHGFADCAHDEQIELPRFRVLCSTLPEDQTAWIQVAYVEPGRLLGKTALSLLARREGADLSEFRAPPTASLGEARSEQEFRELVLEGVGRERARAGIAPLSLAEEQSLVATRLAPRYFAAQYGSGGVEQAEVIVLGLMAGWDVEGMIRESFFTANWAAGTRDVGIWLANTLEFPWGRRSLLDPAASALALGPVIHPDGKFSAALVVTYAMHDASTHRAEAELIFERIARARAERGLTPPRRMETLEQQAERAAQGLQSGSGTPMRVLMDVQTAHQRATGRPTAAYVFETTHLELFSVPDILLERGDSFVAIAVSHYQPPDSPWGRYVVLILVPQALPRA